MTIRWFILLAVLALAAPVLKADGGGPPPGWLTGTPTDVVSLGEPFIPSPTSTIVGR